MQIFNENDQLVELEIDYSRFSDDILIWIFMETRSQEEMNVIKHILIERGIVKEKIIEV